MLSAVICADRRYPAVPLAGQPGHERNVRPGPLVLESAPLNPPTPTTDTDRTVSRRSEPSSCTTLTGEQPDPWDLPQPQDVTRRPPSQRRAASCATTVPGELPDPVVLRQPRDLISRHRGAKPRRRCELSG